MSDKNPSPGGKPVDELFESELTMPGVTFRGPLPPARVATPLGAELRATAVTKGGGSPAGQATLPSARLPGPEPNTSRHVLRGGGGGALKPPPRGLPLPGQRMTQPGIASQPVVAPAPAATPASVSATAAAVPSAAASQPAVATPPPATALSQGFPISPVTTANVLSEQATGDDELIRLHKLPAPEQVDPSLFFLRAPDSAVAASFRILRHRVAERPGLRVLAVTSPGRREGKTTVALNLALALGESGRARVLLLEMNLRYASLARVLGFRPPVCFGDQLEFHRTHPMQPWVVVENLSPHLHVAAVSPDTQARALVDGPAVAIAIEQLRAADYHYIVLDCPPVLGSADLNLLTEHVDGVLFSMWLRRSRVRQLRRAMDQIGREKVIGSVLVGGP